MFEYNIKKSAKAQAAYCESHEVPHFAPSDGWCWYCHENIYKPKQGAQLGGITVAEAGRRFITGCPHCNRSYCD